MSWSFALLVVVVVLGFMFPPAAGGVGGKSPVVGERRLDCPSNILGASNSSRTFCESELLFRAAAAAKILAVDSLARSVTKLDATIWLTRR